MAHVSYFREEYVGRLEWITESRFAEIMSLTQFIPGPGSSQLGAAIGYERAGLLGGFATWIGFTLPSALILILVALGVGDLSGDQAQGALRGLKLVALAVVTGALVGMRKSLAPDLRRIILAFLVLATLWVFSYQWMTVLMITISGAIGVFTLSAGEKIEEQKTGERGLLGWGALFVFFLLLLSRWVVIVVHSPEFIAQALLSSAAVTSFSPSSKKAWSRVAICRMKYSLVATEQPKEFPARSSPSRHFLESKRTSLTIPGLELELPSSPFSFPACSSLEAP